VPQKSKAAKSAVKIVPPTKAEARDEDPCALPPKQQPDSKLQHYMDLATIALKDATK
jgi:hypothetical protein